ncbi:hypothetical protein FHS31_001470 [Sphingomonas vulcanisoli]|uniref:Transposase n=1 Tax=Sphingomonas vulcanisoli TaxID=1658060 RepID=A0ABX0TU70_9SPHN|nr:transposase [Sphingomonas vulcanisoli]NIJ07860.1 hypothetical protein [Sphingomonas vulcanisoli]
MTLAIDPGAPEPMALGAFLAAMEARDFDGDDEAAYVEAAPLLAGLSADRGFLGDLLIEALKDRAGAQERDNGYGPQVVLLHRGPGWFVRANLWPEAGDALVRASGAERFFYGIPHDHNFSFLTVGHFGPGYWSDYFEPDGDFVGVPGEPVSLRFIERTQLSEGKVALYRAHRDIHSQLPPESLSVSLNIVQGTAGRAFLDQYRFDVDRGRIAEQLARSPIEPLLGFLAPLGGEEGRKLLDHFSAHHPCDRIRFGAFRALADAAPDDRARCAALERAADDASAQISGLARMLFKTSEMA